MCASQRTSWTILVFCLLGISALIYTASAASANPALPEPDFESRNWLFYYLFIANLPIDLFMFSILMLFMCRGFGREVGRLPKRSIVFVLSIIVASLIIAAAGAIIDIYAFYESYTYGYSLGWGTDEPLYTSANLYLALFAIFISVLLVSIGIARTTKMVGLLTATAMTGLNLFSWMLILKASTNGVLLVLTSLLLSVMFLILSSLPLYGLAKWHSRLQLGGDQKRTGMQTHT